MNPFRYLVSATLVLGAALLSACGDSAPAEAGKSERSGGPHLVEVAPVESPVLAYSTTRSGTLHVRRAVKLFSQEEGRIETVSVYEGDKVSKGQLLVQLDDRLLRAQLDKAIATRTQAATDVSRVKGLVQRQLAPADELARFETALRVAQAEEALLRTRLEYTRVHAPFDGVVTERLIEPGDAAPRFTHLVTLVDPDSLFTEVSVSELLLPTLQVGAPVQVRIDALGQEKHPGQIVRIHPTVDSRTRQGIVEVALTRVPQGAAAGQLCRVTLRAPEQPRRVIPFASLRRDREGEYVFVVDAEAKARRRAIRSGLRLDDQVEVLEGLEDGEQVVVKGFLGLADGTAVKKVAGHSDARRVAERGADLADHGPAQ